jgi:GxxExxY protein
MYQLSHHEEVLCKEIVDSAFKVHKQMGPGLLERIYEACFCQELDKKGIPYKRQIDIPLYYENVLLKDMLRLDVLVDDLIIVENKAVESLLPLWYAQVRSYLKLFKKNVGFLLNYNVVLMEQGIRRFCIE